MTDRRRHVAATTCDRFENDPTRLLDILLAVQAELGHVPPDAVAEIAGRTGRSLVEIEGVISFYTFLSDRPQGEIVIRLCDDVVDRLKGSERVAAVLEEELGIRFGETTADGRFTLERTSCIGMSDQAPAALINGLVMPRLEPSTARRVVRSLREHAETKDLNEFLVRDYGDGNNAHDLVHAAVHNNIRLAGAVLFAEMPVGAALERALAMSPAEVIREIKTARLRGRGGAGFPVGMKWELTRASGGDQRVLICNADEGEPGTFKDRVLLTERADLVFEGMTIAGYAIGANQGILYLRAEYAYLRAFLEHVLDERRQAGLLGDGVGGHRLFDFDIRIQMGAGAYICGEETALISSCEGLRGDPKTRPPFLAQSGYLGRPTSVNNVETLCCAARILEKGSGWFASLGTRASTGTKLLSISGDCRQPGVYEVPFGTPLREVFALCGAGEVLAAQVGGPSGRMVGEADFDRTICFDDLATGGSLMIFGKDRDVLAIASAFMEFFAHESCGTCTPCRVGNVLLQERLDKLRSGLAEAADLAYLEELGRTIKTGSRCGLGQTSPNPVLSTLESFRPAYEALLRPEGNGQQPGFDIRRELSVAEGLTGRSSVHFPERQEVR